MPKSEAVADHSCAAKVGEDATVIRVLAENPVRRRNGESARVVLLGYRLRAADRQTDEHFRPGHVTQLSGRRGEASWLKHDAKGAPRIGIPQT